MIKETILSYLGAGPAGPVHNPALGPEGQTPLPDMYQAEEHSNITITSCQYPSNAAIPPKTLNFDLVSLKPLKKIYAYDSRLVAVRHIDEFFRGRLHCDLLRAREGKIDFVLADLRMTDTGQYQCVVHADGKNNFKAYNLTVTASRNQQQLQSQPTNENDSTSL
ncbi:unnamed protein product [Menidia menidia]|uniref:(Atlantic silverside) hypothetical protein n=1 Tax=Menidia menidia TaxID=238744 RepID=A0A8S4BB34_9TELE|nr:unnamed protein product [Menidia menidia]